MVIVVSVMYMVSFHQNLQSYKFLKFGPDEQCADCSVFIALSRESAKDRSMDNCGSFLAKLPRLCHNDVCLRPVLYPIFEVRVTLD